MSRSPRARPDLQGETFFLKSVRLPVVLVFAFGLLLGGALGALSWSALTAPGRAREQAPMAAIAQVAGWDTSATDARVRSFEPGARRAPQENRTRSALTASLTSPARALEEAQQRARTPAEIARGALGFTAFVRGGHVYGAGVLLDRAGHVLTCRHVVAGLPAITVSFSDGSSFDAELVDSDPVLDIALLKIDSVRASALTPASVTSVELGDDVFALGAPRKLAFSLSRGMVSFIGRSFDRVHYLQTDLAMNGGSSGGPVLNERGEVIALSSFVLRDSEGLAFALPIDYAYRRFRAHLQRPAALEGGAGTAFEDWLAALDRAERKAALP